MLSRTNGWVRLWIVFTVALVVYFAVAWPVQVSRDRPGDAEYQWKLDRDMESSVCSKFLTDPLATLTEPRYPESGEVTCYYIFNHRRYSEDQAPVTKEMVAQKFSDERRNRFFIAVGIGGAISIALSLAILLLGLVTAWVVGGFKKKNDAN